MKKLTLKITLILLALLIFGCQNKEAEIYSNDNQISEWVKLNKDLLSKMSRQELSKLSLEKQKAALRSFTPKRKKELWKQKMNWVLSQKSLSKEEKKYMAYLTNILNNETFEKHFSKDTDDDIKYWIENGQKKFGWTNKFIFESFFIIGNVLNYTSKGEVYISDGSDGATNNEDCECTYGIYCWLTTGGSRSTCRDNDDCEIVTGCGAFGNSDCEGICE